MVRVEDSGVSQTPSPSQSQRAWSVALGSGSVDEDASNATELFTLGYGGAKEDRGRGGPGRANPRTRHVLRGSRGTGARDRGGMDGDAVRSGGRPGVRSGRRAAERARRCLTAADIQRGARGGDSRGRRHRNERDGSAETSGGLKGNRRGRG